MESFLEEDLEIKETEENRRENVFGCEECCLCLSLSLRPLWHNPCPETPVIPIPTPSQSLSTTSFSSPPMTSQSPFPVEFIVPYQQVAQQANSYPSESSSPPPKSIPPPVWAIPRRPRNRTAVQRNRKPDLAVAPYEWATKKRATVHKLDYLVSRQILNVSGEVRCKRCSRSFEMQYNLLEKFREIGIFINQNHTLMLDRAPSQWMSPNFPNCRYCGAEKSVKPCISAGKRSINWLFLFLGEMIGCCKLTQLRYFCKQQNEHRTGAKDRVVYSTYFQLCGQLDPTGEFFSSLINSDEQ